MDNISINQILQYYAIFCLAFSPISLLMFIFFAKKTKLILHINNFLDQVLGIKPKEEKTEGQKDEKKTPEATNAETGVSAFNLIVGDSYFCMQTMQDRNGDIYDTEWLSDNRFVGIIDESGLFKSNKIGLVNIFCCRKGDAFDTGTHLYAINVCPKDNKWFGHWFIKAVSNRMSKIDLLAHFVKTKISSEIPAKGIICLEGKEDYRSLILQLDETSKLSRCVIILKRTSKEDLQLLKENIEEVFEKVELEKGNTEIWVRRTIDDSKDEVGVYCFLKKLKNGNIAFAIGQTWREYGDIDEFLLNIKMAEKQFIDCLPNEEIEELKAVFEEKNHIKEAPIINNVVSTNEQNALEKETLHQVKENDEVSSENEKTPDEKVENPVPENKEPQDEKIDEPAEGQKENEKSESEEESQESTDEGEVDFDTMENFDSFEDEEDFNQND